MPTTYIRNSQGEFERIIPLRETTDTTLTLSGKPADAKAVGDKFNEPTTITVSSETDSTYIPLKGELVLYEDIQQMKLGDGVTAVDALPYYTPHSQDIADIWTYLGESEVGEARVYGLYVDMPNKIFTRVGRAKDWTSSNFTNESFYGQIRRCTLADDGTVIAYYGDENYVEDGTNGQVMVEIPKFLYKVKPEVLEDIDELTTVMRRGTYFVTQERGLTGYKVHPAFMSEGKELDYIYVSAYENCIYDTSEGIYITNDAQILNTAEDKLGSIVGVKPASGQTQILTRPNAEIVAKNRGINWHNQGILEISAIQMLMIIELGMFNTQTDLGQGVVSISDNSSYNCASNTGSTSSLGNTSGSATTTTNIIGETVTENTTAGKVSISWRGIENPYGNVWEHICGLTIIGNGSQKGGKPHICLDRLYQDAGTADNYVEVDFCLPNASNYVSAFGYDPNYDWLFIPGEAIGANTVAPVGDYLYVTANLNGSRTALLGGRWDGGADAGLFYWTLYNGLGFRIRSIGARAVFIPNP